MVSDPLEERPSGPRSQKGARTRARLVVAAKEIFEEHGFLEARISDIAERAGLSYGSFYHYFTSKEEVFREVARAQEAQLGAVFSSDQHRLDGATPAEIRSRLAASIRQYLADYRAEADIMGVIEQVARFDAAVSEGRAERHRRFSDGIAGLIAELQAADMADAELDPSVTASALMAMLTRFAEAWFVQHQITPAFDDGVGQVVTVWLNALRIAHG
jgi:AcrR family transcriptional regulator